MESWRLVATALVAGYVLGESRGWFIKLREARARKIRMEVDRIRGGISPSFYVPNSPPPPTLRMKLERWWWAPDTLPRTPEQVALIAYRKATNGNKQDGSRRGLV